MQKTRLLTIAGCLAGLVFVSGAQAQNMTTNEVKGTKISSK